MQMESGVENLMELNIGRYVMLTTEWDMPRNCTCVNKKAFFIWAIHDRIQKFTYKWFRLLIASNPTRLEKFMSRAEWYVHTPRDQQKWLFALTIKHLTALKAPKVYHYIFPMDSLFYRSAGWRLPPPRLQLMINTCLGFLLQTSHSTTFKTVTSYTMERGTSLTEIHPQFDVIRLQGPSIRYFCFHL